MYKAVNVLRFSVTEMHFLCIIRPFSGKGQRRIIVKPFATISFYCPHLLASFVEKTSLGGLFKKGKRSETPFKQIIYFSTQGIYLCK